MGLFKGSNVAKSLFVGSSAVQQVYVGSNKVWEVPPNINFPGAWTSGAATAVWEARPQSDFFDTAFFTASYQQTRGYIYFGGTGAFYVAGSVQTLNYEPLLPDTSYNIVINVTVAETDGVGGFAVDLFSNGVGLASGGSTTYPSQGTGTVTLPITTNAGGDVGVLIRHRAYLASNGSGQSTGNGRTYRVTQAYIEYA